MPYSREWEQARERLAAWWRGEDLGRPMLHIAVPSGERVDWPVAPASLEARWTDIGYRVALAEAQWRASDYVAEGLFSTYAYLGPATTSSFLDCDLRFAETTSWQAPVVASWEDWRPTLDPDNRWWRLSLELMEALAAAGRGRWVTSPGMGEDPFDIMANLRGPQRLCVDIMERPDVLAEVRDEILRLWPRLYRERSEILRRHGVDGTSSWLPLWGPGRLAALQCDFSCMVSPSHFAELIRPGLRAMARSVDHVAYHWDGPRALVHLRHLLSLEELRIVQWVPGDGKGGQLDWPRLLRHIAGYGKALQVSCSAEQVLKLIDIVPPRLIYASVGGLASRDEAEAFVAEVERRCREPRDYALPSPEEPYAGEEWYPLPRPV